jgi:Cro/C1-type HTH DNA-binding domain
MAHELLNGDIFNPRLPQITAKVFGSLANNTVTRFDLPVIEGLCQYFGVNLSDLLEYIPPENSQTPTARK